MITTTVIVLGLFVFGTVELIGPAGAGGGEGPNPIWTPSSKAVLPIQVIGQQWKFTYRYPTFGGFEIDQLVVPVDTPIAFHVTSLDVIHSFWAYQLGVKADANPASDNVAFTTPQTARHLYGPLLRAVRPVARCDVQLRHGRDQGRSSRPGRSRPRPIEPPRPSCCRPSPGPTCPTPTARTAATTRTTSTRTVPRSSTGTAPTSPEMSITQVPVDRASEDSGTDAMTMEIAAQRRQRAAVPPRQSRIGRAAGPGG